MKKLTIGVVIGLAVVGGLAFVFKGMKKPQLQAPTPTAKPKLSLPLNDLPISERPFVMIQPTPAREVVLSVGDLIKKSESVDFELQYSAADKEEAAIGSIDFAGKSFPVSKTILLGTQSGGGKITYHEGVTGGSLVLTFYGGNYKLSNEWAYIDNKKPQALFGSRDGKFSMEFAKPVKNIPYVIVYNNPGLPKAISKLLLAGPYSVAGSSALPDGKVTLTMRLAEDKQVEILGWDGKIWKSYSAKVAAKTATATVDVMQTYVAVEK